MERKRNTRIGDSEFIAGPMYIFGTLLAIRPPLPDHVTGLFLKRPRGLFTGEGGF